MRSTLGEGTDSLVHDVVGPAIAPRTDTTTPGVQLERDHLDGGASRSPVPLLSNAPFRAAAGVSPAPCCRAAAPAVVGAWAGSGKLVGVRTAAAPLVKPGWHGSNRPPSAAPPRSDPTTNCSTRAFCPTELCRLHSTTRSAPTGVGMVAAARFKASSAPPENGAGNQCDRGVGEVPRVTSNLAVGQNGLNSTAQAGSAAWRRSLPECVRKCFS